MAKELECDESEKAFDKKLKTLAEKKSERKSDQSANAQEYKCVKYRPRKV